MFQTLDFTDRSVKFMKLESTLVRYSFSVSRSCHIVIKPSPGATALLSFQCQEFGYSSNHNSDCSRFTLQLRCTAESVFAVNLSKV